MIILANKMSTRPLIQESLLVLNGNGVDPYTRNVWSNFRFVLSLFLLIVACFNVLFELIFNWRGLNSMDGMAVFTAFFQISTKYCIIAIKREDLVEVINKMNQFWPINKYGIELQHEMENIFIFARKTMKFMLGFTIVGAVVFFMAAVAVPTRRLPYPSYYPTDLNQSPDYEIGLGLDALLTLNAGLIVIGFNFLFVSLIINITCQLKIVNIGIKAIPINLKIEDDHEESLEELYKIVEHHNLILECIKHIRGIYSFLFLFIYFINMVEMALGMLSMIATGFPPNMSDFTHCGVVTIYYMFELLFYCVIGQHLITESERVSATVYEIDWWVKTQPQLRRALVLIIQRANKPENLTAGGMFALNLSSFRKVTRSALSFFTLVNAVYRDT